MFLAAVVAVVVLLGVARVAAGWRNTLALARAGAGAVAERAGPGDLTPRQRELLVQFSRLGFTSEPSCRVRLDGRPSSVYANARSADGTIWFRSAAIEGSELSTLNLLSHYPGGRLVTASDAHRAVDPREVVQCQPDGAPARLLALHQEAMATVERLGARPVPLPDDLTRAVVEEWRGEGQLILDMSRLGQVALSRTMFTGARPTPAIPERPDLDQVARLLAGAPGT